MPSPSDLLEASALEQARLVRERQVSCRELAELYLARIERLDPSLSAFVEVTADAALAQARRYDRLAPSAPRPPFFGVPVGVKDLNLLRGTRTRFGTKALPALVAPIDDASVGLLRRAGFVFLGKTTTSELGAMPVTEPDIHPPTRNPWAPERSAGGSSGGSAAAVAAGLLPVAQASDGAGSVRIPASFNHLYGFKPSRGRVPEPFHRDDRDVLYTMGPLARTVDDAAAMLDVLAGLTAGSPHWAPPPPRTFAEGAKRTPPRLRVRFAVQTPLADVDPEARAAVLRVAALLEAMGHRVEEGTMVAGSIDDFLSLWPSIVRLFPIRDWSLAQPVTRWLAGFGADVTPARVSALQEELERRVLDWFEGTDVWLTPTVPVPPPPIGAWASLEPAEAFARASTLGPFTAPFNASGQPAASLPAGLSTAGLPLGVQLVGKPFADALVLALSRQLEEAMPWAKLHPPIWSARSSLPRNGAAQRSASLTPPGPRTMPLPPHTVSPTAARWRPFAALVAVLVFGAACGPQTPAKTPAPGPSGATGRWVTLFYEPFEDPNLLPSVASFRPDAPGALHVPGAPNVPGASDAPDAPNALNAPDDADPFSDRGAYFRAKGVVPPADTRRASLPFGAEGWLTLEASSRSPSARLADLAAVVADPAGGPNRALRLRSPRHTDATVVRPSAPLPRRYRVSLRVGYPDFGDGLAGGTNGYDGGETAEPWSDRDATEQNGFYWLAIADAPPGPHNNVWVQHHRKVVVDSDNHHPPWMEIFTGSAFEPGGEHPIMLFALDGAGPAQPRIGKPFLSWSNGRVQPSGAVRAVDRYLPNRWYTLRLERNDDGFVVELEGEFRHGGRRAYRAAFPFAQHCVWHYNRPGERARAACLDESPLPGANDPAPQWPAAGGWPDWFFFGDPHTNYYEGTVYYDDLRLEGWREA